MADKQQQKIMIVEQDETYGIILGDLLTDEGYQAHLIPSGEAAMEAWDTAPDTWDLILINPDLHDMDGYHVLDFIQKQSPQIDWKILIISHGILDAGGLKRLQKVGADGFICSDDPSLSTLLKVNSILRGTLKTKEDEASETPAHLSVNLPVDLPEDPDQQQPYIRSLSTRNTFIQTKQPMQIGQSLKLELTVPGTDHAIPVEGIVTWKKSYQAGASRHELCGMGLQFEFDDPEDEVALTDLLNKLQARKRLLLVDEDPIVLHLMKQVLEQDGFIVFTLSLGVDVLFLTQETHPDIILMDVEMPDFTGARLCKILKTCTDKKDIKCILHSAKSEQELKALSISSHADGYIIKSAEIHQLGHKLSQYL